MEEQHSLQSILSDPFLINILNGKESSDKRMPKVSVKKWVNRCKAEVKLSKPRFDGNDVEFWADECEAWLVNTTNAENVKFCVLDIPTFRNMLHDWLMEEFDKVA